MKIKDAAPPPHAKYVVRRDGHYFTATPCYGMHAPCWVVRLMPAEWPNEADPVVMQDDDEWWPLEEFQPASTDIRPKLAKSKTSKEEFYDTEILPLVDHVIGILINNDYNYLITIQLDEDEFGKDLFVTSAHMNEEKCGPVHPLLRQFANIIMQGEEKS